MGDGQLHFGKVAVQQIHVVPRDDLLVDLLAERFSDGDDRALDPGSKAAQDAADAHLGAEQAQLGAGYGKLQIVYTHDLQALRVDDLAVHEVACKQHLVGLQVAEADVVRFDLQSEAVVIELVDVLAP